MLLLCVSYRNVSNKNIFRFLLMRRSWSGESSEPVLVLLSLKMQAFCSNAAQPIKNGSSVLLYLWDLEKAPGRVPSPWGDPARTRTQPCNNWSTVLRYMLPWDSFQIKKKKTHCISWVTLYYEVRVTVSYSAHQHANHVWARLQKTLITLGFWRGIWVADASQESMSHGKLSVPQHAGFIAVTHSKACKAERSCFSGLAIQWCCSTNSLICFCCRWSKSSARMSPSPRRSWATPISKTTP